MPSPAISRPAHLDEALAIYRREFQPSETLRAAVRDGGDER